MSKRENKVHFRWMEAYWSCTPTVMAALEQAVADGKALPDFDSLGIRELRSRPKGRCQKFSNYTPSGRTDQ